MADPALSGIVAGNQSSDTQANASTGPPAFTTLALVGRDVGSYAITGPGLTPNNGDPRAICGVKR
jgi:hypothetical protein